MKEEEKPELGNENLLTETLKKIEDLLSEEGFFNKINRLGPYISEKDRDFLSNFKNYCNNLQELLSKTSSNTQENNQSYLAGVSTFNLLNRKKNEILKLVSKEKLFTKSCLHFCQNNDDYMPFQELFRTYTQIYKPIPSNIDKICACAVDNKAFKIMFFLRNEEAISSEMREKINQALKENSTEIFHIFKPSIKVDNLVSFEKLLQEHAR